MAAKTPFALLAIKQLQKCPFLYHGCSFPLHSAEISDLLIKYANKHMFYSEKPPRVRVRHYKTATRIRFLAKNATNISFMVKTITIKPQ